MVQRPPAGTIPDAPGSYQFKDRDGRVIYVGQGPVAAPAAVELLREAPQPAAPHRVDGGGGRDGRVDPGAQRRRGAACWRTRSSSSHQPRFNVRLRDDKSYPFLAVTLDDRVAPADGDARPQAQGRALLRALRPRLRDPRDARPAAAHLPAAHLLGQQVQPAPAPRAAVPAVPHREVLRAVRRRGLEGGVRPARRRRCSQFLDGDTDTVVQELETRMHEAAGELEFEQAARLRDRLTSVQQGDREAADGGRAVRGLRRDRHRRRRARGRGAGVLRPQGPGGRAARASSSTRSRTSRPSELVGNVVERLYDDPPQGIPKTVLVPVDVDDAELYEEWLVVAAGLEGRRCACRSAGDKRELQETVTRNAQRGVRPPPAAPGVGPQQPGPGPQRAAGAPRPARRRRCGSSATT